MSAIRTRLVSAVLAVLLAAGAFPLAAFAAGATGVTKITVTATNVTGETHSATFTSRQQLERLLDLLPTSAQKIPQANPATGGMGVEMKIYRGGPAPAAEWYFSDAYIVDQKSGNWYSGNAHCRRLLLLLTGYKPEQYAHPHTFNGENVVGFYTLDGANHTYNVAVDAGDVIKLLESTPQTKNQTAKSGFLLFTDKGRYAWYYSKTGGSELLDYAAENNSHDISRRIQWLAYMNPDKIQQVTFGGLGGGGYTVGNATSNYSVGIDTKDPESIRLVASFLKNIVVKPGASSFEGMPNPSTPAGLYTMDITFTNGVQYHINGIGGGAGGGITIGASDLNRSIYYEIDNNEIKALRDFISLLPDATLAPADWGSGQ